MIVTRKTILGASWKIITTIWNLIKRRFLRSQSTERKSLLTWILEILGVSLKHFLWNVFIQLMRNKEVFLLLIFSLHYTQKVPANIDNETIRLQLKKHKVWNKGTKTAKVLLVEWIKSRNYKKIKSENSISKSCWCNTLVTAAPPLSQTLLSPDVSHKYFTCSEIFNSLHIPHCFLYYSHKFGNPSLLTSNM